MKNTKQIETKTNRSDPADMRNYFSKWLLSLSLFFTSFMILTRRASLINLYILPSFEIRTIALAYPEEAEARVTKLASLAKGIIETKSIQNQN